MTYRVTIEPVGREVECAEGQSVLDACLRAGIWLPHACTHGTCGTCKAAVVSGQVDHGDSSEFALMDFERAEGKALLCTARPCSDVVVEADVQVERGVVFHPVEDYRAEVALVEDVAPGIRRLVLDLDRPMQFNPGQYVSLDVPGTAVRRSYSIATPPSGISRIELDVKRTAGGLASDGWIFGGLVAGAEVSLTGPYGRFFFREGRSESVLMIAGGTGLAPLKAMVRHVLATGLPHQLTLYHGARVPEELYDRAALEALAAQVPEQFRYVPVAAEGSVPGLRKGLVTEALAEDHDRCGGHVAYVCGPPPMVDATLRVLMERRLFPRDIYREDFYDEADKVGGGVRSPLLRR